MFKEEIGVVANVASNKVKLLKSDIKSYFVLSMLAGALVGFGIVLIFTIGGLLAGTASAKIMMGVSFGVALSLVVMAGSELFTGNNFIMVAGLFRNTVTLKDVGYLWGVCWLGNLVGSILLAVMFDLAGLNTGATGEFIAISTAGKMTLPFTDLMFRAILCNMLVCLAVWCSFKMKSESGKLIMIFWCLFTFITCGFEHSIANMTLLTLGLFSQSLNEAITFGGYLYNIIFVSLGNMLGAILFIGIPYAYVGTGKFPSSLKDLKEK
ncbi:nitrite transporter NirC [Candidatus Epulonipiscium fishelsonii]|uniref:Nitrite transporter NirC n=1 Tax=Candidatus Epulonipiscium fishelsonii TaxID=77094 RepID=A0ACC8XEM7_9FIRM|nr:nitrite transporter NirC [Epulopiscium sp. SCG-B11WGA-EpuloA1]ONI43685.1 nitrite transporter NirC [Epulopiscium sp. SCG-B05WGA-EpuloA1]